MSDTIPAFSELPLKRQDPPYSAWALYGDDDELGTLNRLTDGVVASAAKEIKSGKRISLDLPLNVQGDIPLFGRHTFSKSLIHKKPRIVNDDVWTFNTQSSSQWDGLRHFAYQNEQKFYNGATLKDIHDDPDGILGIHASSKHGIVGRGILLDYDAWRLENGVAHNPFQTSSIKLEHLKAVAESQGTEIRFGDVLIVRSGYTKAYYNTPYEELKKFSEVSPPHLAGVEQSEEVLEWIWNNFSAVAGDHPTFECWPTQREWAMHEIFLAGWGMPIGEMFDLEELARHCHQSGRWSFFLSSKPCNVPGGVASPPNVVAIF
ncbi:MAG: hypothetical protein M1831_000425 [Alyxoria varia]|nr:MAG: hypothetical protein M1831_000425 [Alyxoria varia]